jgi:hypothetical protein
MSNSKKTASEQLISEVVRVTRRKDHFDEPGARPTIVDLHEVEDD